jgi:hypothetical protein
MGFIAIEAWAGSPSWVNVGKVTRLHTGHGDGIFLFSTEANVTTTGCPATNLGYVVRDAASNSNRLYSTLMAAYMAQKPISIYVTGQCIIERPEVGAIQITEVPYY